MRFGGREVAGAANAGAAAKIKPQKAERAETRREDMAKEAAKSGKLRTQHPECDLVAAVVTRPGSSKGERISRRRLPTPQPDLDR